jgi:hypothetical protein
VEEPPRTKVLARSGTIQYAELETPKIEVVASIRAVRVQ